MTHTKLFTVLMALLVAPSLTLAGQASVQDNVSKKDIVKIAAGSPDHTTLVTALQAADYVDVLANPGPFTVFAPTNAAFAKLPKGTVETLLKPENKEKLRTILEYHVFVGGMKPTDFKDGQTLNQASLDNVKVSVKGGKLTQVNNAGVQAGIPAANGFVYVIDTVLLPPEKK